MPAKTKQITVIPAERIASLIFFIRGQKVMIDRDIANLYGVTTGNLNKAVKRNLERFPNDFMFQLTKKEHKNLIFQTGRPKKGGTRFNPFAFTEQGVAMLSSVLNSKRAIYVNIQIMRTFTRLRQMIMNHAELQKKIEDMERKFANKFDVHGKQIQNIFEALKQLLIQEAKPKAEIGFKPRK